MEVIKQSVLALNLVDEEVTLFLNLLAKVKTESSKAGFKRLLDKEELELLEELIQQCKK